MAKPLPARLVSPHRLSQSVLVRMSRLRVTMLLLIVVSALVGLDPVIDNRGSAEAHTAAEHEQAAAETFDATGAWVDVFDFNPAHSNGRPRVVPADVDRMADAGARTLFIQASRSRDPRAPGDLVSPELLAQFMARAKARRMRVVGWYLPEFVDVEADLRRVRAMLRFAPGGRPFDAIGIDIESRAVADPAVRSARLVDLSRRTHTAAAGRPVAAIVLPPVLLEVVNPAFWPNFPWAAIRSFYGIWVPMSYWTDRTAASGFRDPRRNTLENVARIRRQVGEARIHVAGGIGTTATADDYAKFRAVLAELGIPGRSIYDWSSGGPATVSAIKP
ncbi:MAG: hypothetical protein ACT4OS_11765 [Acidimicrobiales bacterium]